MPKQDWSENNIQKLFTDAGLYPTGKIETILDVACGLSFKSQYIDASIRVGVDIYRPYLEKIAAQCPYVVIESDVRNIGKLFLPNSFDLVLLLDIVEHVEKEDALTLIEAAESIARVAVIIETPKGYVPQNIDIWGHGGHEFQTHRCGWEPAELIERGYDVLIRDYIMCDIKRHTRLDVDPEIQLIDAILRLDKIKS